MRGRRLLIAFIVLVILVALAMGILRRAQVVDAAETNVKFSDAPFRLTNRRDDLVVFGLSTISLESGSQVNGDVALVALSDAPIQIDGRVDGDLTVFGSSVALGENADIRGDVVLMGEKISVDGHLQGDLLLQSPNSMLGQNAEVLGVVSVCGQDVASVADARTTAAPLTGCKAFEPIEISPVLSLILSGVAALVFAGFAALGVTIFPRQLSQMEDALRRRPRKLAGIGLAVVLFVAGAAGALVMILASGPAFGIVLAPLFLIFVMIVATASLAGGVTLALMLGDGLLRRFGLHGPPIISAFVGSVLWVVPLFILMLLPWGGPLVLLILLVTGILALGAGLETRLGTRAGSERYFVQG